MIEKINKFFNLGNGKELNEYDPTPRIKKTVKPDKEYSFNEVFENVYKQLKK